jgi:hypothetical protein
MKLKSVHVKTAGNAYRDTVRVMGKFADIGVCEMNLGEIREKVIFRLVVSENEDIYVPQDVEKVEYHEPCGEGDKHYFDVFYKDGIIRRIFAFKDVYFRA